MGLFSRKPQSTKLTSISGDLLNEISRMSSIIPIAERLTPWLKEHPYVSESLKIDARVWLHLLAGKVSKGNSEMVTAAMQIAYIQGYLRAKNEVVK